MINLFPLKVISLLQNPERLTEKRNVTQLSPINVRVLSGSVFTTYLLSLPERPPYGGPDSRSFHDERLKLTGIYSKLS